MTTRNEIYRDSLLIEVRDADVARGTVERRDQQGNLIESRPLTPAETDRLNQNTQDEANDASWDVIRTTINNLTINRATKDVLIEIVDRIDRKAP